MKQTWCDSSFLKDLVKFMKKLAASLGGRIQVFAFIIAIAFKLKVLIAVSF